MTIRSHIFRFLVGLDQACNPIIFGGSENVTLSSQSAYNELILGKSRFSRISIDFLFRLLGQKQHCYYSLLTEIREFADEDDIRKVLAEQGIQ